MSQQVKRRKTRVIEYCAEGTVVRETLVTEDMVVAPPVSWPIASFGGYTTAGTSVTYSAAKAVSPPAEPGPEKP